MINTFAEANIAIATHYLAIRDLLPEEAKANLDEVVGNPVLPGKVSGFLELGYKHRNVLTQAQKLVVAEVGQFAYANGFYGLGENARGYKMVSVLNGTMTAEEAFPVPVSPVPNV